MFGNDWETQSLPAQPVAGPETTPAPVTGTAPRDAVEPDRRALYLRWRPRQFADVVGQEHVTRTLQNAVKLGRLAHAYLLTGPRGTGKTSIARILYRAANCSSTSDGDPCNRCPLCLAALDGRAMDLVEIDAASNRGIEDIREIRERIAYRPSEGRYRVYIVDEAHELTPQAWDAFLKTLEEPPDHAIFVLATTEAHKVPATIVSRCQRFDLRKIPFEATREQLQRVAAAEGLNVGPQVVDRLARAARGGLRDALSLLDQLSAFGDGQVDMAVARSVLGLPPIETVHSIAEQLGQRNAASVMSQLLEVAEGGADLRQLVEELAARLRGLLLVCSGAEHALAGEFAAEELRWLREQSAYWTVGALLKLVQELTTALARTRDTQQFQTQVELSLLGVCHEAVTLGGQPVPAASRRASPTAAMRAPAEATEPTNVSGGETVASEQILSVASTEPSEPAKPLASDSPLAVEQAPAEEPVEAKAEQKHVAPPMADAPVLERARLHWADIVERACSRNVLAGASLSTAQPLRMEGETLVIGFERFSEKQASAPLLKRTAEDAIQHALGHPCKVKLTRIVEETGGAPRLNDDPVINHAVRLFGGRPRRLDAAEPELSAPIEDRPAPAAALDDAAF